MENETLTIVVQESVFLILGVATLYANLPFVYLFVVYALSRLLGLAVASIIYRLRFNSIQLQFDWPFSRNLLVKSWPFAAGMVLNMVYARSAILMLSYYQGDEAAGYYEAAYNPALRLVLLAILLNGAMLPILSRYFLVDQQQFQAYVNKSIRYVLIIGIPITLCLVILADSIIVLLYGDEFLSGVLAFRFISLALVFKMVGHSCATSLTAANQERFRALSIGIVAILNVALNLYLIPKISHTGAGLAALCTEFTLFLLFYVFARRVARVSFHMNNLWKPLVAAVPMIGVLFLLREFNAILIAPLAIAVYFVVFIALKGFSQGEMQLARRLVGGSRQLTS